jgi:hypothetical protein
MERTWFEWLPDVDGIIGLESFWVAGQAPVHGQITVVRRVKEIVIDVESDVRVVHPISLVQITRQNKFLKNSNLNIKLICTLVSLSIMTDISMSG